MDPIKSVQNNARKIVKSAPGKKYYADGVELILLLVVLYCGVAVVLQWVGVV